MPLQINVGLSKKASRDYQSTGTSINLVAELDSTLLARPQELQQQIHSLYAQAQEALEQQAGRTAVASNGAGATNNYVAGNGSNANGHGNGYANGNNGRGQGGGHANGDASTNGYSNGRSGNGAADNNGSNRSTSGGMTQSQRRCITAIAARLRIDPELEARDIVGSSLGQLGVRQASQLIDHLKSLQPANGRYGGAR